MIKFVLYGENYSENPVGPSLKERLELHETLKRVEIDDPQDPNQRGKVFHKKIEPFASSFDNVSWTDQETLLIDRFAMRTFWNWLAVLGDDGWEIVFDKSKTMIDYVAYFFDDPYNTFFYPPYPPDTQKRLKQIAGNDPRLIMPAYFMKKKRE